MLCFNLNSNWITDICQPGILQNSRFLKDGIITRPRDAIEQSRDCPPEFAWPLEECGLHICAKVPPCVHANLKPLSYTLSPLAATFVPMDMEVA